MDKLRNKYKNIASMGCCIAAAMAFSVPMLVADTAQASEARHVIRFGSNNDKVHEMRGFKEEAAASAHEETAPVEKPNDAPLITPPPLELGGPSPVPLDISKPGDFGFNYHFQQSHKPGFLTKYHKDLKVMHIEKDYFGIHMMGDGQAAPSAAVGLSWNLK